MMRRFHKPTVPNGVAHAVREHKARRNGAIRDAELSVSLRQAAHRNAAMIEDRLAGMSKQEIAGKYNAPLSLVSLVTDTCEPF
ncbi:MAG: hypothetical protein JO067_02340 [Cupriavidus sp.]|nr:hypothetical protein [Cupriavidus sp.]